MGRVRVGLKGSADGIKKIDSRWGYVGDLWTGGATLGDGGAGTGIGSHGAAGAAVLAWTPLGVPDAGGAVGVIVAVRREYMCWSEEVEESKEGESG